MRRVNSNFTMHTFANAHYQTKHYSNSPRQQIMNLRSFRISINMSGTMTTKVYFSKPPEPRDCNTQVREERKKVESKCKLKWKKDNDQKGAAH